MSATIDLVRGSPGAITVNGRGTKGYRVYLHVSGTGEKLGTAVVDNKGEYVLATFEKILQIFKDQKIDVCVRETNDNLTFSDWSLSRDVYIFPPTGIHDA